MAMFEKKEASSVSNPKAMNQLGQGTVINGEINSDADIRIDGIVRGNVVSKGKIVLGSTGVIEGDIRSENAYLEGRVNGNVEVNDLLILSKTSFVNGDIIIKKLVVEEGAKFNGKCTMGAQASRIQTDITSKSANTNANVVRPIVKAV